MGILTGKLKQKATWWRVTGGNGFGGDAVASPILVDCRWEDRQETFIGQIDRRELVSNAVVFLDRDVAVGDYLVLGDQTTQSSPSLVTGVRKIQRYDKISNLRNLDHVRRVIL